MSHYSYSQHCASSVGRKARTTVLLFNGEAVGKVARGEITLALVGRAKGMVAVNDTLSLRRWAKVGDKWSHQVILTTRCTSVDHVVIDDGGMGMVAGAQAGRRLSWEQLERFARRAGFESFAAMQKYFREHNVLPFNGVAIGWGS